MRGLSELEKELAQRPGLPADEVMEDLAERLGVEGEVDPPVDLELLASLQSIAEIRRTPIPYAGCLINDAGQLRIEVCSLDNLPRQNFTIAHEICHTLLPGFRLERNFRCNPGESTPRDRGELNVEWLADVGASELLLPRRFVSGAFLDQAFGLDAIEEISRVYWASLEATARRYVRLSAEPAFFARLELRTSRADPRPRLRVLSASCSRPLEVFIPQNKSLPSQHPIVRTLEGEFVDEVADMSSLSLPGRFQVSARPYPYTDQEGETVMRVLVLGIDTRLSAGGR